MSGGWVNEVNNCGKALVLVTSGWVTEVSSCGKALVLVTSGWVGKLFLSFS